MAEHDCDFYAHGDDPVYDENGDNFLDILDKKGKFGLIKRTTGVSTTDITGKLMRIVDDESSSNGPVDLIKDPPKQQFLQTGLRINLFSNNREPKATDTIVYYSASCDLLHPGVIRRLQKAKEQGNFLYVGIWDDEMTKYYCGSNRPLLSLQERVLMALACRYVDDVVIGAPYILTEDLITSLNISKVVYVTTEDDQVKEEFITLDPYEAAKKQGIYVELPEVEEELTVKDIAMRVFA